MGFPAGQNIQGWIQVNSRMGEVILPAVILCIFLSSTPMAGFGYGEGGCIGMCMTMQPR